jgi:tetratricopeptide (TPR) repeat protein
MELSIPPSCGRIAILAQRHPRRAARLAERALHHTRIEAITHAWARYTYGWALLCWERIDAARAQLLVALEHFGSHQAGALRCRYALLLADQLQLARPQLDRDFAEMSMQYMALGAPLESARISIEHARHLTVLGSPRAAEILLDQAAPALAGGTPIDLARLDRIRGVAANARTDFPRAAALLTRAEQVFLAQRHPIDAAKCWLEQAWLALRQEQLDVAEAGYARAERVFLAHDLPLQQAFCAKNMSLLMAKRGAYNQAMQASLRALAAFIALGRAGDIGACQLHLGNIHFYTAGWDAALARYLRAEAIYNNLGMHGYCLLAQRNRAMVYRAQGRHAEARALLTIVEAQAHQLDAMLEVAEVRSLEAAILAESGAWEQAAQCFGAARALFAQHQNHHGVAECDLELGWIALAQGQTALAHALFQASIPTIAGVSTTGWRAAPN